MSDTGAPIIREAVDADLARIVEIVNEAILNTTAIWTSEPTTREARRDWMALRRAQGYPVIVAVRDGRTVAFAACGPFRVGDGYAATAEHSIYVDPAARGTGVGRALLTDLVARARALDLHVMVGGIEAGNAASLALHAAAGFVETGRLPQVGAKFGRRLDLVFMQKMLRR